MKNIGLVLEGGGMRSAFTAGVLDNFLDKNIEFPYIVGVSAGACTAFSYVSKQKGRSLEIYVKYANDKNYISYRGLIRTGSIFGMDFLFDEIPKRLVPFDYETFDKSEQKLVVVTTNAMTGEADYYDNTQYNSIDLTMACRASSSIPLVSKEVLFNHNTYLDGGVADPLPIMKSIQDGNTRNVIVLTRNIDYRKKASQKSLLLAKWKYKKYPKFIDAMQKRIEKYNLSLDLIDKLEKEGNAFVIRPTKPINVDRIERNTQKLSALYNEGYSDTENIFNEMVKFIEH